MSKRPLETKRINLSGGPGTGRGLLVWTFGAVTWKQYPEADRGGTQLQWIKTSPRGA